MHILLAPIGALQVWVRHYVETHQPSVCSLSPTQQCSVTQDCNWIVVTQLNNATLCSITQPSLVVLYLSSASSSHCSWIKIISKSFQGEAAAVCAAWFGTSQEGGKGTGGIISNQLLDEYSDEMFKGSHPSKNTGILWNTFIKRRPPPLYCIYEILIQIFYRKFCDKIKILQNTGLDDCKS